MNRAAPSAPVSSGTGPPSLSFDVFAGFDEFASSGVGREEWDAAVLAAGGDIYSTFDWCRTWFKHFGQRRRLRLFLFRDGKDLACILPMFVETARIGPMWLRLAKLVGSDSTTAVCHPGLPADRAREIVARAVGHLVQKDRCDAVQFGPLAGYHPAIDAIRDVGGVGDDLDGVARLARDAVVAPHTVFRLPESFDAYLASLSKGARKNFRRDLRKLTKGREVSVDVIRDGKTVQAELANFVRMHTDQWQAAGKLGHFGDWPGSVAFQQDFVEDAASAGRLRLIRLLVDGTVASYQLCFAFGDWYYCRLAARLVGEPYDAMGLGRIAGVQMIEVAIDEGAHHSEDGPGHYRYKLWYGAEEHSLRSLIFVANRWSSRLRSSLFIGAARALHLLYLRGWYVRVAPRLPLPQRPLWRSWIRSRL